MTSQTYGDVRASTILKLSVPSDWAREDSPSTEVFVVVLTVPSVEFTAGVRDLRIAPVSFDVDQAAELDLKCEAGMGPWDRPFMIEVWNARPILFTDDVEPFGQLDKEAFNRLVDLHNSMFDGEVVYADWCGSEIESDDDPRLEFQRHEFERFEPLSSFVSDLIGSSEESETIAVDVRGELQTQHFSIEPIRVHFLPKQRSAPHFRSELWAAFSAEELTRATRNLQYLPELTARMRQLEDFRSGYRLVMEVHRSHDLIASSIMSKTMATPPNMSDLYELMRRFARDAHVTFSETSRLGAKTTEDAA
jgi:hypothetical protein